MANPHVINWTNPATYSDGTTPYPESANTGYEITFDGGSPIALPGITWATTFDMATLPAYQALKQGSHTVELAALDSAGASQFTAAVTFSISLTPSAPTNLAIS